METLLGRISSVRRKLGDISFALYEERSENNRIFASLGHDGPDNDVSIVNSVIQSIELELDEMNSRIKHHLDEEPYDDDQDQERSAVDPEGIVRSASQPNPSLNNISVDEPTRFLFSDCRLYAAKYMTRVFHVHVLRHPNAAECSNKEACGHWGWINDKDTRAKRDTSIDLEILCAARHACLAVGSVHIRFEKEELTEEDTMPCQLPTLIQHLMPQLHVLNAEGHFMAAYRLIDNGIAVRGGHWMVKDGNSVLQEIK